MTENAEVRWQKHLDGQKDKWSQDVLDTWFRPMACVNFDEHEVVLESPSDFHRRWILDHYVHSLSDGLGDSVALVLTEPECEDYELNDYATKKDLEIVKHEIIEAVREMMKAG